MGLRVSATSAKSVEQGLSSDSSGEAPALPGEDQATSVSGLRRAVAQANSEGHSDYNPFTGEGNLWVSCPEAEGWPRPVLVEDEPRPVVAKAEPHPFNLEVRDRVVAELLSLGMKLVRSYDGDPRSADLRLKSKARSKEVIEVSYSSLFSEYGYSFYAQLNDAEGRRYGEIADETDGIPGGEDEFLADVKEWIKKIRLDEAEVKNAKPVLKVPVDKSGQTDLANGVPKGCVLIREPGAKKKAKERGVHFGVGVSMTKPSLVRLIDGPYVPEGQLKVRGIVVLEADAKRLV